MIERFMKAIYRFLEGLQAFVKLNLGALAGSVATKLSLYR
jgi:hypothetical protein